MAVSELHEIDICVVLNQVCVLFLCVVLCCVLCFVFECFLTFGSGMVSDIHFVIVLWGSLSPAIIVFGYVC
jgi:hypothetical protein